MVDIEGGPIRHGRKSSAEAMPTPPNPLITRPWIVTPLVSTISNPMHEGPHEAPESCTTGAPTAQPGWVVPSITTGLTTGGRDKAGVIVCTPPPGIAKWISMGVEPLTAFASWIAARNVHSAFPSTNGPPVSQTPFGEASLRSPTELTTNGPGRTADALKDIGTAVKANDDSRTTTSERTERKVNPPLFGSDTW
jgi:hypothetical protein